MGLVSETRALSNLGQRQIAIFQKLDSAIDAAAQDELMYRQLRRLAKGGREGPSRHSGDSGEMIDRHPAFQIVTDRRENPVEPLGGQDRRLLSPSVRMAKTEQVCKNQAQRPFADVRVGRRLGFEPSAQLGHQRIAYRSIGQGDKVREGPACGRQEP